MLVPLGADPIAGLPAAIDEIAKWKTVVQCEVSHSGAAGYFAAAEERMEWQWRNVIWPLIKGGDFTAVLELACGHGRNTEYLRQHAGVIHLVDVNRSCLDACRSRFGDQVGNCRFFYHLTDGNHFRAIGDRSITFGYSWDSMVHFDKVVVRDYLIEFYRVLRPGGRAFLHHSNYGAFRPNSDWATNYGTRSNMSAELFRRYAAEVGLRILSQRLSGIADGWGMDDIDCLSLVERPAR
jgi:ubiquinone/menaquinone biosynthesis C-methylase UbiE